MKKVILCADDFGQSQEICRGILSLIEHRKISATSCLVDFPCFSHYMPSLLAYGSIVDIGLHLNLTMEKIGESSVRYHSIKTWLLKTHLTYVSRDRLRDEIRMQLDTFLEETKGRIDFIDGHEHVHHLPGVRSALLDVYREYFPQKDVYIRSSLQQKEYVLGFAARFKASVITYTGARRLAHLLDKHGIPRNRAFGGIYGYGGKNIALEYALRSVPEGALVMCHPAVGKGDASDPLLHIREQEYKFLMHQHGVMPVRFKDVLIL